VFLKFQIANPTDLKVDFSSDPHGHVAFSAQSGDERYAASLDLLNEIDAKGSKFRVIHNFVDCVIPKAGEWKGKNWKRLLLSREKHPHLRIDWDRLELEVEDEEDRAAMEEDSKLKAKQMLDRGQLYRREDLLKDMPQDPNAPPMTEGASNENLSWSERAHKLYEQIRWGINNFGWVHEHYSTAVYSGAVLLVLLLLSLLPCCCAAEQTENEADSEEVLRVDGADGTKHKGPPKPRSRAPSAAQPAVEDNDEPTGLEADDGRTKKE